jgi:hypothetical protein
MPVARSGAWSYFPSLCFALLVGLFYSNSAFAFDHAYRELLDAPFPSADAPFELHPSNYRWQGVEALPPGSTLEWDESSVQWSRIDERIVLPRARVKIEIPGADGVLVSTSGRSTPLQKNGEGTVPGVWSAEVLVPLVSGEASTLKVRVKKGTAETETLLFLESVESEASPLIGVDSSCSPWHVELSAKEALGEKPKRNAVILADCRIVRSQTSGGMPAALDLFLFIDGAGKHLKLNGSTVVAVAPSLFRLRLTPQVDSFEIETEGGARYNLDYRIPQKLNRGFIGAGVGPYRYKLDAPGVAVDTTAAVLTLYGSYQFSDTVRFTAFNATALHANYFTDTGFYFKSDSLKLLDQRVLIYVMLGANLIGYKFGSGTQKKWGVPQGFEAVYRDFLSPNRSLVAGAFVYPPIDGKSYYNTWVRYGSPSLFGEINYLEVRDAIEGQSVYTRSVGFSLGFPLARFF